MKEVLKSAARGIALLAILPFFVSFRIKALVLGRNKALLGSSQTLSMIPGLLGQYLRRAFLSLVLEECGKASVIEFGVLFSQTGTRIGENSYIGPYSQIGLAHIRRNVLLAPAVHVPSGPMTHGTDNTAVPIRDQPGSLQVVTIGEGCWVGSGSVIMADVGPNTIIGAGSVVTKPLPGLVIAGGVPAKVIRSRDNP
jgi:virginiamycin A acetyltransferase